MGLGNSQEQCTDSVHCSLRMVSNHLMFSWAPCVVVITKHWMKAVQYLAEAYIRILALLLEVNLVHGALDLLKSGDW